LSVMRISCIIPTRNRPEYLPQAVASVLTQSHSDFELLIVNDGTTILPDFHDTRVRIIDSGQSGAVLARNLGVASATGTAIAWLDDDDVWTDLTFLAQCANLMAQGSDFIFADGALVFPDGTRKAFTKQANVETLQHDNTILISAVCYRRSLHTQLGSFDLSLPYYWDWDWYLRVAANGYIMTHVTNPVVDIRIHAQNMSGNSNEAVRKTNLTLLSHKHNLAELPLKSHIDFV
jgi:glycosyltransferase involved in cell wall biosynthesis